MLKEKKYITQLEYKDFFNNYSLFLISVILVCLSKECTLYVSYYF